VAIVGGKLNVIIGILIGVVAVLSLTVALIFHFKDGPPDNGALERDGFEGTTVKLRPLSTIQSYTVVTDSVDLEVLEEAVSWWNGHGLSHSLRTSYRADLLRSLEGQTVRNKKGFILMHAHSDAYHRGGIAEINYDKVTGEIWSATVVINRQHTYDRVSYLVSVKHELGHAPFGLDDDPLPGIDLNSIMRANLLTTGGLSKADRLLLGGR